MHEIRKHTLSAVPATLDWSVAPDAVEHRHRWLCELSDCGRFMFHGSSRGDINELSTARQSSDNNEFGRREQVFATPDLFWAMWFALLDRSQIRVTANSCFVDREKQLSYYKFAIDAESFEKNPAPLKSGWVYILSPESFTAANQEVSYRGLHLAEFGSCSSVVPLGKIEVRPSDFPYVDSIRPHEATQQVDPADAAARRR